MTALILKIAHPQLPSLARLAAAFDTFFQAWADAKALQIKAQQRYPFTIE